MKVTYIITDLETGGAENMLANVVTEHIKMGVKGSVISLQTTGYLGEQLDSIGVPVRSLAMRKGRFDLPALLRLTEWLIQNPPDLVQTWMYHADLIGGVAAQRAGRIPVVWSIRHAAPDMKMLGTKTRLVVSLNAILSRHIPRAIVCCAKTTLQSHARAGFVQDKLLFIPNGIDTDKFSPNNKSREVFRKELGIANETPLVGLCGRFNIAKDHHTFIQAAAKLHQKIPDIHFLLCGKNVSQENKILAGWVDDANIRQVCHLLGERMDMPVVLNELDLLVLSSRAEAFPSIIGEAMATGIPCVATEVGDSPSIIGDTGIVVPPSNPDAISTACEKLLNLTASERASLGEKARKRIEDNFSLKVCAKAYLDLYEKILSTASKH